jgi:hypothetical protein
MKKLVSAVLIALLAGMPALAEAQGPEKPAQPPEAAKSSKQAWADWSKVARIKAGSTINLTVTSKLRVARMFVSANDAGLTVLDLSLPSLSWRVKSVLMDTAAEHPERYGDAHWSFKADDVLVSQDGVFLSDQRVAAIEDVVIRVPRECVVEISRPKSNAAAAKTAGGLVGVFLGGTLGGGIGAAIADTGGGILGFLIGTLAGLVVGIWRGSKVNDNPIVYRAPAPPA